jgi:hypothetical protein
MHHASLDLHWSPDSEKGLSASPPKSATGILPVNIPRFPSLPLRTNALIKCMVHIHHSLFSPTESWRVPQMPLDEVLFLCCRASVTQEDECRSLWCFRAPHGTAAGYSCHHDQNCEHLARHGRGAIRRCCNSPDHARLLEERVRSETTFPPCSPRGFQPPPEIQIMLCLPASVPAYCCFAENANIESHACTHAYLNMQVRVCTHMCVHECTGKQIITKKNANTSTCSTLTVFPLPR